MCSTWKWLSQAEKLGARARRPTEATCSLKHQSRRSEGEKAACMLAPQEEEKHDIKQCAHRVPSAKEDPDSFQT